MFWGKFQTICIKTKGREIMVNIRHLIIFFAHLKFDSKRIVVDRLEIAILWG